MSKAEILFHIARQDGLEFVFTSGNSLRYPTHTHTSVYTITVVRRGVVRLHRQSGTDTYPAGSMYIVAPHEPHSPDYTDTFALVSLCIDKELFFGENRAHVSAICLRHARSFMDKGMLDAESVGKLLSGVDVIISAHAAAHDSPDSPGVTGAPGVTGVPGVPGVTGAPCVTDPLGALGASPKILRDLPLCNDEPRFTGATHRLSRFHFIRKFKRETGLTPHQFVMQSRIRKAKKLLAANTPIAEAALLAGFYDQSHLNRWFARSLGVSPRIYRLSCFFLPGA